MDWNAANLWWVGAGLLVAVELATGTFYLLMMALGMVAGAVSAHLGLGTTGQVVVAAVVGGGATAAWHLLKPAASHTPIAQNSDVNIDIGERVHVDTWNADGTARVAYRGSTWTARLAPNAPATAGPHRVSAVEGNWLVLSPAEAR